MCFVTSSLRNILDISKCFLKIHISVIMSIFIVVSQSFSASPCFHFGPESFLSVLSCDGRMFANVDDSKINPSMEILSSVVTLNTVSTLSEVLCGRKLLAACGHQSQYCPYKSKEGQWWRTIGMDSLWRKNMESGGRSCALYVFINMTFNVSNLFENLHILSQYCWACSEKEYGRQDEKLIWCSETESLYSCSAWRPQRVDDW